MASSTSNCQNRQLSMSKRRNRSQFNFLVARSRKNRWVGQIISGQAMFQEKIWPIQVPDTKIARTSQIWSCPHPIRIHLMCRGLRNFASGFRGTTATCVANFHVFGIDVCQCTNLHGLPCMKQGAGKNESNFIQSRPCRLVALGMRWKIFRAVNFSCVR